LVLTVVFKIGGRDTRVERLVALSAKATHGSRNITSLVSSLESAVALHSRDIPAEEAAEEGRLRSMEDV